MSAALDIAAPTNQPDPDRAGTVAPAPQPDADRAGAAASACPTNANQASTAVPPLGRVARLLRRVVAYGKDLLIAVRVRATTPDFPRIARPFGTTDLKTILARIAAAISRADMLEGELRYRADCEQAGIDPDEAPSPSKAQGARRKAEAMLADASPADRPASLPADQDNGPVGNQHQDNHHESNGHQDNGHQDNGPQDKHRQDKRREDKRRWDEERRAAGLPTIAQITAELRRLPIGVVIANICRDLGITSEHPLWPELTEVITAYGGSTTELRRDEATRWCSKRWLDWPFPRTLLDVPMAVLQQLMAPCPYDFATGPP